MALDCDPPSNASVDLGLMACTTIPSLLVEIRVSLTFLPELELDPPNFCLLNSSSSFLTSAFILDQLQVIVSYRLFKLYVPG
jgi:hypothetical protein